MLVAVMFGGNGGEKTWNNGHPSVRCSLSVR